MPIKAFRLSQISKRAIRVLTQIPVMALRVLTQIPKSLIRVLAVCRNRYVLIRKILIIKKIYVKARKKMGKFYLSQKMVIFLAHLHDIQMKKYLN